MTQEKAANRKKKKIDNTKKNLIKKNFQNECSGWVRTIFPNSFKAHLLFFPNVVLSEMRPFIGTIGYQLTHKTC